MEGGGNKIVEHFLMLESIRGDAMLPLISTSSLRSSRRFRIFTRDELLSIRLVSENVLFFLLPDER